MYPELRRSRAISGHEEEHSEEEHAEINEALLAFLQARGTDTQKYDDTLEELATAVNHHCGRGGDDDPQPGARRGDAGAADRAGTRVAERRNELLEAGCASEEQVEALLDEAVDEGVLAPEEAREEADASRRRPRRRRRTIEEAAKKEAG